MISKGLGGALLITAAQPSSRCNRRPIRYACVTIQEICQLPSASVNMDSQPSKTNCRNTLYTNSPDACRTQFPFQLVQAAHHRDRTRNRNRPPYLSHSNNHCRYYDRPTLYSCPMIHEELSRIHDGEAIEGGVRSGWERREVSTNL
jgi:hypothetical protein